MNKTNIGIKLGSVALIGIIIAWSALVYSVGSERIIEFIGGNESGYIAVFIGGLLGGISLFFPFPNYLLMLTFGAAGLSPILLGLSAGLGLMLGETTSYAAGYAGRHLVSDKWHIRFQKFASWILKKPYGLIATLLVLFGASPIPNDYLLVPLGLVRYPPSKIVIPLVIGNLIYTFSLAFIGYYGMPF